MQLIGLHQRPKKRARIGQVARWDDPKARPEDLLALAKNDEYRALANPNFPLDKLIKFADKAPQYIERNPSLYLYELEDPSEYQRLVRELNNAWITTIFSYDYFDTLRMQEIGILAAWYWVEQWEEWTNGDLTYREFLQTSLRYAQKEIEPSDYYETRRIAQDMVSTLDYQADKVSEGDIDDPKVQARYSALNHASRYLQAALLAPTTETRPRSVLTALTLVARIGLPPDEAYRAELKEMARLAKIVRSAFLQDERSKLRTDILAKVKENAERQAKTKAQAQKAVALAQEGAKKCAEIMSKEDPHTWPIWLGLGIAGGVACLVIGPAVLGIGGASAAVAEVVAAAESAEIGAVSVQAFIDGAEVSEAGEATEFLQELIAKLRAKDIEVLKEAVEAVVKVAQ